MPKLMANGINIHYWQVGKGPDIVMIHGLSGNLAVWHLTLVPLLRDRHRITMYDLRGHGRTDMPASGYTTRHMAEDLLALMTALQIDRAHLVGHSLGADIALHAALLQPQRVEKIVAMEAGTAALVHLRNRPDWSGWEEWAKAIEKYGGFKVPQEKWHDVDFMLRQSLKVPVVFGPAAGLPRKGDQLLKLLDTTTLVEEYQDASGMTLESLSALPHPVLLIYGSASTYLGTYDVLRNLLPHCTPLLIDDGEHFGMLEQPQLLGRHIDAFLQPSAEPRLGPGGAP